MAIDRSPARAASGLALVLLLTCDVSDVDAAGYNWIKVGGGSATTATNWSPTGVPGALDDATVDLTGSYTILWDTPADTLRSLTLANAASPRFAIVSRLGIAFHPLLENNTNMTVTTGRIDGPSWLMVVGNSSASLTITGPSTQAWALAPSTTSLFGSTSGSAALNITNGGAFRSAGEISFAPGTTNTVNVLVSDNPGSHSSVLATTTSGVPGRGWIAVGDYGHADLLVAVGAVLNPSGDLFVGRRPGASGSIQLLTDFGVGSTVDARGQTYIGANDIAGTAGGTGSLDLRLGTVSFQGRCWIGDADDTPPADPTQATAVVQNGDGNLIFAGGLTLSPMRSGRLDLLGGTTQVIGGTAVIQQGVPFELGSSFGQFPLLWFENGTTNDIWAVDGAHPALGLGRGNDAILKVSGAGTLLNVHGATVIGDSLNGNGLMQVDSSATCHVFGKLSLGGSTRHPVVNVYGPGSTLTVEDSTVLFTRPVTGVYPSLNVDTLGTANFLNGLFVGSQGGGGLFVSRGGHVTAHGITFGPGYGGMFCSIGGTRVDVTDHLDITGLAAVGVDSGAVLSYAGGPRALLVGGGTWLGVFDQGFVDATPEIDVRGSLVLYTGSSDLLGQALLRRGAPISRARVTPSRATASTAANGRVKCPLTRGLGTCQIQGHGLIDGRLHIDSGTAVLIVAPTSGSIPGRLMAGDSTKSDGFVSVGQTTIAAGDTLKVLDSDGGDLGKVRIDGGVLQLPKPGHLKSGLVLQGSGTVDGSLDVRDSAWVSFQGQVTGDVSLAGTLDLGPTVAGLLLGSFHPTTTGVTTFKVGHTQQDLIIATGPVVLAGTIDVRSLAGDTPVVGDTFAVMVGGPISGSFATVRVNGHPAAGTVVVLVRASDVRVAFVGAVTGVDDPPSASVVAPASLRFAALGGPRAASLGLDLPTAASVRVTLYDVTGRQVEVVAEGELGAGRHRLALGRAGLGSGMYFARAKVRSEAGTRVLTTRAVVLR